MFLAFYLDYLQNTSTKSPVDITTPYLTPEGTEAHQA